MATLPKATTLVQETAGVPAGGLDVVAILAPVFKNADTTPRFFGSAQAVFDQHDYSEGLEYAALHIARTRKAVLFLGLPVITQGVLSRYNSDGNTGTSVVSVTAGSNGCQAEHDGVIVIDSNGTNQIVGTNSIVLALSIDGGVSFQKLRVGLGNSIAIPYLGVTIALGAGFLVSGDTVLTWHGSAPLTDTASRDLARTRLASQQKSFRSVVVIGDMQSHTDAQGVVDWANNYETANERCIYARANISDRLPLAASSSVRHLTVGASLTFAAAGHTVTRAAGSFITDGFAIGDVVAISGSVSNNGSLGAITGLSATVMTFGSGVVNEGPITAATVTGRYGLVFAAAGFTITRNAGSWITAGFKIGQTVAIAGTASNNTAGLVLTGVTATVLTFASAIVNETIGLGVGTVTQVLTEAAWMAAQDTEYAPIDAQFRIDLASGRARVASPFSQWSFRRPWMWATSIREYQHDLHVATWRKSDGPTGFDLFDQDGNRAEWDDRIMGGAGVAARFTCARTWANGPNGAFVALSLTRSGDGKLSSLTNKVAVINLCQTVVQLSTENAAIGVDLILNDDGTATTDSLNAIQKQVNDQLELNLLVNALGEGPRASKAVWTPNSDTVFNVPEPLMLGVCELILNGTVHSVQTAVRVVSGGQ